ncbi:MAG: hypothetical protein ACTHLE_04975 [Agriterribacter sp.]
MKPFIAEIPPVVREMIVIKIEDNELSDASFEYSIMNHEKKICRKGHFTGSVIQLRVSHLKDGMYYFHLSTSSREPSFYSFEKKSKQQNDLVEFDFS